MNKGNAGAVKLKPTVSPKNAGQRRGRQKASDVNPLGNDDELTSADVANLLADAMRSGTERCRRSAARDRLRKHLSRELIVAKRQGFFTVLAFLIRVHRHCPKERAKFRAPVMPTPLRVVGNQRNRSRY